MNISTLKKNFYFLAIQGKLNTQDANDEPASVLLDKIKKQKQLLIKEGKIKKNNKESVIFKENGSYFEKAGRKDPVCIDEEIPFDIPDSWCWSRLDNIVELINGDRGKNYPAKSKLSNTGEIPFISAINLSNGEVSDNNLLYLSNEQYNLLSRGKLKNNDLIFCLRGSLGKNGIFKMNKGAIASSLVILRRYLNDIDLKYFVYYINSNLLDSEIKKYDNGTAQPNLSASNLKQFFVPIPPLKEQKRIVNILNEVDNYVNLDIQLSNLNKNFVEKFKELILQEAVQGKLVAQDPNDEPASLLLKKIQEEKEKLIKAKKIKKNNKKSTIYKENGHYYEKIGKKEPVCIDDEIPFEIPDTWEWVRLGFIGDWKAGSTPKRGEPKYYVNGSIPWLKTGDLNNGIIEEIPEFITETALKETSVRLNPVGSVLIAMYGATIGKVGILNIEATTNQACCACLPYNGIYNKYLFYFLMSQNKAFNNMGEGGAQPNISRTKIVNYLFPIPPLSEQKRIVDKIEQLFENVDVLID